MIVGKVGDIFSKDVRLWVVTTPVDLSMCAVDFGVQKFAEIGQRDLCLDVSRDEFEMAVAIVQDLKGTNRQDVDIWINAAQRLKPGDWVLSDTPFSWEELLK